MSIFIVIAGFAALRRLTISLYPDILPPTVEVSTARSKSIDTVVVGATTAFSKGLVATTWSCALAMTGSSAVRTTAMSAWRMRRSL